MANFLVREDVQCSETDATQIFRVLRFLVTEIWSICAQNLRKLMILLSTRSKFVSEDSERAIKSFAKKRCSSKLEHKHYIY